MGYELVAGETVAVVDETGEPLTTTNVTGEGAGPPYGSAATAAIITDDGSGNLVATGQSPGVALFGFVRSGTTVEHEITVTAAPFDWTLGEPVDL